MAPTDFSGALKSRHNLYDHLSMLVREAEESISLMTTGEGVLRKARSLKPLFEKAKKRGVKIKIMAPLDNNNKDIASQLSDVAEIKSVKDVSGRFCVIDGKQIMFMLLDDKEVHPTYDLGFWVNTPFFAKAMQNMFDRVWSTS
jgi:hypothetical protein